MSAAELAERFQLHRAGRSWRGRCPACGYAEAFTLDVRNGRPLGWCASCQDNAAIGRLMVSSGSLPEGWTPGAKRRGRLDVQRGQER